MELFHVDASSADLVSAPGPVVVTHAETGLPRPLVVGQDVLVTDTDGEYHAAVVLAVTTHDDEPAYHLHIGVRLPPDLAAQRIMDVDVLPENAGVQEVVDLLGDLRRSLSDLPTEPRA